ncbi:MAG: hypothetical protein HYR84_06375 [Planctomycetes bacterium]|nr:hypothetical protein [Planctomycetota bacterium]
MNWLHVLRRWTMQTIHAAILGSALLGSASLAEAQTPITSTANKLPPLNYTRSQSFNLPINMDKNDRMTLSEIRLYVRTPTTGWQLQDKGGPDLTQFNIKAAQDGEYWYTLALVDRTGRMTPSDVNLEPPQQRVVIDTKVPVIAVQPWNSDGDFCLRCAVQDANPDYPTLKAVCRTPDGEIPLEIVPNQPGVFRVKGADMMRFPIVVSVRDLAGNVGTKEVHVRDLIGSALNDTPTPKGPATTGPTDNGPDRRFIDPPPPRDLLPPPRGDLPPLPKNDGSTTKIDPPAPVLPSTSTTPMQLINTTRATVAFRIDQEGPSGVGKVEIYMTPDKSQTWHRLGEVVNKLSPAEITLPGDGVYGIRFVVTNGNGFGGKAPARGDAPHYSVEVDTTLPFVQLKSAELVASRGTVEIRWNAHDKNLGNEPVSLFYRTRADGPWTLIAKNVKNDGVHRWAVPRDAGGQFFFKIEVADQAGNVAQHALAQPTMIDMAEPRITVVGVTGAARP